MMLLITRPWARRALPLTVASVLALSLVPLFPASPAVAGDRGERCQQAASELKPIQNIVSLMKIATSGIPPFQMRVYLEERILPSVQKLEQTLKASENQEVLSRIRVLSERLVAENYSRSLVKALDGHVNELSFNISRRREFEVTFVDGSGQTVTKKIAC